MEILIAVALALFCIIVGYLLGSGQIRKDKETLSYQHGLHIADMRKHYNDAITLSNQHAHLATQLFNQNRNPSETPSEFPPPAIFAEDNDHPEVDQPPDSDNADITGGNL